MPPQGPRPLAGSDRDRALIRQALGALDELRRASAPHAGRVRSAARLSDLVGLPSSLVGGIRVVPAASSPLVVLGDLHGCFNTFRAALDRVRFIQRAEAGQPAHLVCLGDYVNRGLRSAQVLRLALWLLVRLPLKVTLLRGNHDEFHVCRGRITPAALPADWLDSCRASGRLNVGLFEDLSRLFDALPGVAVTADGVLLTHAGPPSAARVAGIRTLGDLDTPSTLREMRWARNELGRETAAPSAGSPGFGRRDLLEFMERLGVRTLIAGHRVVPEGAHCTVLAGRRRFWTVSSMGGVGNPEAGGHYGRVTPCMLVRGPSGPFRSEPLAWQRVARRSPGAGPRHSVKQ